MTKQQKKSYGLIAVLMTGIIFIATAIFGAGIKSSAIKENTCDIKENKSEIKVLKTEQHELIQNFYIKQNSIANKLDFLIENIKE